MKLASEFTVHCVKNENVVQRLPCGQKEALNLNMCLRNARTTDFGGVRYSASQALPKFVLVQTAPMGFRQDSLLFRGEVVLSVCVALTPSSEGL